MGLVGLKGGGLVGQESTAISTVQMHPLGAIAVDSSGGEYIYTRGSTSTSAIANAGIWVHYAGSSIALWHMAPMSTAGDVGFSTAGGKLVGIAMSTNGSTANFSWVMVAGHTTIAAGISTAVGPSAISPSSVKGVASTAAAGNLIFGAQLMSSQASTSWEVYINYPYLSSALGT